MFFLIINHNYIIEGYFVFELVLLARMVFQIKVNYSIENLWWENMTFIIAINHHPNPLKLFLRLAFLIFFLKISDSIPVYWFRVLSVNVVYFFRPKNMWIIKYINLNMKNKLKNIENKEYNYSELKLPI